MKKGITYIFVSLVLLSFLGCAKGTKGEDGQIKDTEQKVHQLVSEDFKPGIGDMMKTEKGFYYHNYTDDGFHYYDISTGTTMFLCNKPECRHDGNEFCVATNSKYMKLNYRLYGGKLIVYALEATETQYMLKVLSVETDGSGLDEIATIMTFERTGEGIGVPGLNMEKEMVIHRNKAMISMEIMGEAGVNYYGAVILDLDTKEVTYLDEEPLGKDNQKISGVSGYGDWIYYCRKEGKKNILHRYHITEGTDETCKLLLGFTGDYAVLDEDTVLYLRSGGIELCSYRYSTGENKELQRFSRLYEQSCILNGVPTVQEVQRETKMTGIQTDGTYFYFAEEVTKTGREDENGKLIAWVQPAYVHVLNRDLEEIAAVDMTKVASELGYKANWNWSSYTTALHYFGDDIYLELESWENSNQEVYVYQTKREDFLTGEPKFEFVYKRSEW